MVHTFICLGVPVAVDVNSGAVHVLDRAAYDVLSLLDSPMGEFCPQALYEKQIGRASCRERVYVLV